MTGPHDEDELPEEIVVPIEDALDLHPFRPRDVKSVVEEYLEHYCSEYAVRCGIYADVQTCWDEYWDWMSTCQVNSVDDLQTCSTWLADLSCDYQGWTDECDNAFVCD